MIGSCLQIGCHRRRLIIPNFPWSGITILFPESVDVFLSRYWLMSHSRIPENELVFFVANFIHSQLWRLPSSWTWLMNQSDAELYIQFIESIHDVVATLHQVRTQQRAWQVAPFFIDDSGDEIKGTKGGGCRKGRRRDVAHTDRTSDFLCQMQTTFTTLVRTK